MNQTLEQQPPELGHRLSGRKLYSPAALAAYTALANLPMSLILYGLNLKERGRRRLGISMVWFGAAGMAFVTFMSLRGAVPGLLFAVIGAFGALNVYQLEKRPFEQALCEGASRARWWPPALILLVAFGLLFVVQW